MVFCLAFRLVVATAAIAPGTALKADVPAERHLQPPRIIRTTPVAMPHDPEAAGAAWNEVEFLINVDADGQLVDVLLTRSTTPAHAKAAEKALRQWEYAPAMQEGRPVGVRYPVRFMFERSGVVLSTGTTVDIHRLHHRRGRWDGPQLVPGDALDHPLRAMETVPPEGMAVDGETEIVLLDFIVDDEGRPRMPVVMPGASVPHALAAVAALEQWRFIPPRQKGRPVLVRVQQEFRFKPKSSSGG